MREEMAPELLGEEERAGEVGGDHVVPLGRRDVDGELAQVRARIVDQKIERAERRKHGPERLLDAPLVAQIERDDDNMGIELLQPRRRALDILRPGRRDRDIVARPRQCQGGRAADPIGGAGHECSRSRHAVFPN